MKHQPLITVLMSVYNGTNFLTEQLDSLRTQQNVNIKVIIRDDGSTDSGATVALVNNYIKKYPDFKLKIYSGDNLGWAMSFMQLVYDAPDSDYYAFCDQDDIWLPNKLEEAVKLLETEKSFKPLLYCSNSIHYIDGKDSLTTDNCVESINDKYKALMRGLGLGCTCVFNSELIKILKKTKGQQVLAHDYHTFVSAVFLGKVIFDKNAYIRYRIHGGNQLGKKDTFGAIWKRRFKNITKKGMNNYRVHEAQCLINSYKSELSSKDISIINALVNYKSSMSSRISLLLSSKYVMDHPINTFFVKLRIVLGIL